MVGIEGRPAYRARPSLSPVSNTSIEQRRRRSAMKNPHGRRRCVVLGPRCITRSARKRSTSHGGRSADGRYSLVRRRSLAESQPSFLRDVLRGRGPVRLGGTLLRSRLLAARRRRKKRRPTASPWPVGQPGGGRSNAPTFPALAQAAWMKSPATETTTPLPPSRRECKPTE